MSHHPLTESENRTVLFGLKLFGLYFLVYGGYIGLATFVPKVMAQVGWGGVTVAVWYGFGLIALALALAVVYLAKAEK
jgi:uncharacterized membrane protein (DUF485 family)